MEEEIKSDHFGSNRKARKNDNYPPPKENSKYPPPKVSNYHFDQFDERKENKIGA